MKHKELIKELEANKCFLLRRGGNHDIYQNQENGKGAPVPRQMKSMIISSEK
jgi:mRNA interferase HicA